MERQALGWLNQNTLRLYPLAEQSVPSALAYDVIVDATVVVPSTVGTVYLSKLFLTPGSVAATLADESGVTLGVVTAALTDDDYITGLLTAVASPLVSGTLTFGPGVRRLLDAGWLGLTSFTPAAATLEPACLVYIDTAAVVTGLQIGDRVVTGDVVLKAGSNVALSLDRATNTIFITLLNTDQFMPPCYRQNQCRPHTCAGIAKVNGVTPDANGDITIIGDAIIIPNGIPGRLGLSTIQLSINDLCRNYTKAAPGEPGPTGAGGGVGGAGSLLCDTDDCQGLFPPPCPTECQEIIPKPII